MTIAIICEYNPFHNGHAAQIARLREVHPDCRVICIMSGCFTQRGAPAILPPYDRARAAVCSGADLVLELPQPWASGSAEFFAAGGVSIADRLGMVDALSFGCECDDLHAPLLAAERIDSPAFRAAMAEPADPGEGIAVRIERLWRERWGEDGGLLSRPNNLLAVQYCLALRRRGSAILPLPMQRRGSDYHDDTLTQCAPSATAVRTALAEGCSLDELTAHLPPVSLDVLREAIAAGRGPVYPEAIEQAILAHYRLTDPEALSALASLGGGLAQRICSAAREACGLDDLLSRAATKVYTNTRIRRAILHGMLGVTDADLAAEPTATLLLAANARGRAMLREIRHGDGLPIMTKPADLAEAASPRELLLRRRAEALYALAMPTVQPAGGFVRAAPYFAPEQT